MKLKDLLEKYGEYEVDSKCVVGECEIERIVIDLTKPKPKSVWELKEGDIYFVLYTDGDTADYEWKRDGGISKGYRDQGNVFLTEEEAKKEAERRAVEALLFKYGGRRWFRMNRYNYYMWLNTYGSLIISSTSVRVQGVIYFDTEEQAEKAVKEIGEERLKKALFEVRE